MHLKLKLTKLLAFILVIVLTVTYSLTVSVIDANAASSSLSVTFSESASQSQSKTINIPGLTGIASMSVNTGNVTYSVSGEKVTINVSNGTSSKTVYTGVSQTASKTSSTNSFTDTMTYNSGGFSGTLSKSGSSFVSSGSYTPSDSRNQTATVNTGSTYPNSTYSYNSGGYSGTLSLSSTSNSPTIQSKTFTGTWSNTITNTYADITGSPLSTQQSSPAPNSISINSEGYVGTIPRTGTTGPVMNSTTYCTSHTPKHLIGDVKTYTAQYKGDLQKTVNNYTGSYSGTVTKPASDTRIYQQDYSGTVYGNVPYYSYTVTVNYNYLLKPTVSTNSASSITQTSATLYGSMTANGGSSVSDTGFYWGTSSTSLTNKVSTGAFDTSYGPFSKVISSLSPATTYYYQAYAVNGVGESKGDVISFGTLNATPTVSTNAASDVGTTSATLYGSMTANGGSNVSDTGFYWGTNSANLTNKVSTGAFGTSYGPFSKILSGLNPATTYYYQAYAVNGVGESKGAVTSFGTLNSVPTVSTNAASDMTTTSATLYGSMTANGGSSVSDTGFYWGTSSTSLSNKVSTGAFGTSYGPFSKIIGGLSPATTYYYQAYAVNGVGESKGSVTSFGTLNATPAVSTNAASDVGTTSATLYGSMTANGGSSVSDTGFYWGTNSANLTNKVSTGAFGTSYGPFSKILSGLNPATTYYYQAYAVNGVGESKGAVTSFGTLNSVPTVSTNAASDMTTTSATLYGSMTANGGSSVSDTGFYWGTSSTSLSNKVSTGAFGTSYGPFSKIISGLSPATTYYYQAYAVNGVGESKGAVTSFGTLNTVPTVSTNAASDVGTTSATLYGSMMANGGSSVSDTGFYWGTNSANLTNKVSTGAFGTSYGPFSKAITGLTEGTIYYYRAYASNAVGEGLGGIQSFTASGTDPNTIAILGNPEITNPINNPALDLQDLTVMWNQVQFATFYAIGVRDITTDSVNGPLVVDYTSIGSKINDTKYTIPKDQLAYGHTYRISVWSKATGYGSGLTQATFSVKSQSSDLNFNRTIIYGENSNDVAELQKRLKLLGLDIGSVNPDNIFGKRTLTAVIALQIHTRLVINGKVDPQVCSTINTLVKNADQGLKIELAAIQKDIIDYVDGVTTYYGIKYLQALLKGYIGLDLGVYGVDGISGKYTKAAVKAVQKNAGQTENGIMNAETWSALYQVLVDEQAHNHMAYYQNQYLCAPPSSDIDIVIMKYGTNQKVIAASCDDAKSIRITVTPPSGPTVSEAEDGIQKAIFYDLVGGGRYNVTATVTYSDGSSRTETRQFDVAGGTSGDYGGDPVGVENLLASFNIPWKYMGLTPTMSTPEFDTWNNPDFFNKVVFPDLALNLTPEQVAIIYLVDPNGAVEYCSDKNASFRADVYKSLFGVQPKFYEHIGPDNWVLTDKREGNYFSGNIVSEADDLLLRQNRIPPDFVDTISIGVHVILLCSVIGDIVVLNETMQEYGVGSVLKQKASNWLLPCSTVYAIELSEDGQFLYKLQAEAEKYASEIFQATKDYDIALNYIRAYSRMTQEYSVAKIRSIYAEGRFRQVINEIVNILDMTDIQQSAYLSALSVFTLRLNTTSTQAEVNEANNDIARLANEIKNLSGKKLTSFKAAVMQYSALLQDTETISQEITASVRASLVKLSLEASKLDDAQADYYNLIAKAEARMFRATDTLQDAQMVEDDLSNVLFEITQGLPEPAIIPCKLPQAVVDADKAEGVIYLESEADRIPFEIKIIDGKACNSIGGLLNTTKYNNGEKYYQFVMSPGKKMYGSIIDLDLSLGSFMAGGPVLFSGEIVAENGVILEISNDFGYYLAKPQHFLQFLKELARLGYDVSTIPEITIFQ